MPDAKALVANKDILDIFAAQNTINYVEIKDCLWTAWKTPSFWEKLPANKKHQYNSDLIAGKVKTMMCDLRRFIVLT